MKNGVVLYENQSVSELQKLEEGTPMAVQFEGRWWAYVSAGSDKVTPVGRSSFDDQEQALQAAREASATAK
jgi:hypothetical protein